MSDFTMKLGNFEAVPEISGSDNFATGIYENDYDGLLIARCNQNGRYPEHARAILEGLTGKKHGLDQITTLTAERDSLKALCDDMAAMYDDHLEEHDRAMQFGGYVPVEDNYPVEIPLRILRLASEIRALASEPEDEDEAK